MSKPFVGRLDPPNYDYYLGDGVYATFDGFQVWLDVDTQSKIPMGPRGWPSIALNDETMAKLIAYQKAAQDQYKPDTV